MKIIYNEHILFHSSFASFSRSASGCSAAAVDVDMTKGRPRQQARCDKTSTFNNTLTVALYINAQHSWEAAALAGQCRVELQFAYEQHCSLCSHVLYL